MVWLTHSSINSPDPLLLKKKIEPEHMHEERLNLNISSHKINNAEQKALYFKITHVTLV